MGHGKPPPRRCGKGYRTGRYSKPIVAPRARGKKLRRGGGGPNGFLISSFGLRTLLECLGKADKGREERDHSSQELHELSEIGHGHHLPSDGGLCPARGLPTARTILSERLTPARLLPSHRACAKKRAAKQRPSSESACYLGQSNSLKNK